MCISLEAGVMIHCLWLAIGKSSESILSGSFYHLCLFTNEDTLHNLEERYFFSSCSLSSMSRQISVNGHVMEQNASTFNLSLFTKYKQIKSDIGINIGDIYKRQRSI